MSVYSETTQRCIRLITLIDDGGSTDLWNVGLLKRDYTALYQTDHPDCWWRQYGPLKRRSAPTRLYSAVSGWSPYLWWRQYGPLKRRSTQTRLHSAVSGWSPWLMIEAVRPSETSVCSETIQRCIRLITLIDDGGSTVLWNVGLLKRDHTALYPRRL
jgi:hypothetical protein